MHAIYRMQKIGILLLSNEFLKINYTSKVTGSFWPIAKVYSFWDLASKEIRFIIPFYLLSFVDINLD